MNEFVSTLKTAKISQEEFAKVCGVSRVTVNSWCKGRGKVHDLLKNKVTVLLRAVKLATDGGDLPMRDVPRSDRGMTLKHIITHYIAAAKQN